MKLQINDQTTFREINLFFHEQFPYLSLRFFEQPHQIGLGSAKADMVEDIGAPSLAKTCTFAIDADLTAGQLEKWFETEAGLYAQVFRKSGSVWLETTHSGDALSLTELNNKGREHEIATNPDREVPDFREQM